MKGYSKLIGGFLGFLLAGPGGFLVGILIGHLFDKNDSLPQSKRWIENLKKSSHAPKAPQGHDAVQLELKRAYQALGISNHATPIEVKQVYRRFMSRYHPDRLSQQGLSSTELKKAMYKSQHIKQAYEFICKTKNAQ